MIGLLSPFRGLFDPRSTKQLVAFRKRFPKPSHTRRSLTPAIPAIYAARPDLRQAFPLGLTPQGREAFATWLFENGRDEFGLSDDDIMTYLQSAARDRSHGLADTWLLTPRLQEQFPDALTPDHWRDFKRAFAAEHGIRQRWIRQATLPPRHIQQPSPHGVNILAHFNYPSGLQEEALQYASAIRAHGGTVSLRDAPVGVPSTVLGDYLGGETHPITLAKLGVCESLDAQYPLTGWHPRHGVYRIACWSWELETLPRELAGAATLADEIWTPSEFCANAVRAAFPDQTVTAMLPAVSLPKFERKPRSYFGLPANVFLFYFSFDIGSVMERKNPLRLIQAFHRAFPNDDRVHLAIKVTRGDTRPADLAKLTGHDRVTIIDRVLPREEVSGLMDCCDAYVSLHRAEGFGFTMAEAMMLGKPVIATGYSANTEFMTASTAFAVDYSMTRIGRGHPPYPADAQWAEPILDHAARLMQQVYEHRERAIAIGKRAKQELPKLLSLEAAGRRMMTRLHQIRTVRK